MSQEPNSLDDIIDDLKHMTYCECYDCGSRYIMTYGCGDSYMCEECYRTLEFIEVDHVDDFFDVEWKRVKKYLKNHPSPREVVQILLVEIMKEDTDEERIDELYKFISDY